MGKLSGGKGGGMVIGLSGGFRMGWRLCLVGVGYWRGGLGE